MALDNHESLSTTEPFGGFDALRMLVGLLLLVAAGLKGYQLTTSPTPDTHLLNTRWLLILAVEYELLLGLWLLSGWQKQAAWLVTLASFVGFAGITLYKAVTGEASCGCFGLFEVNPWFTFGLDLAIVVALLIFRPAGSRAESYRTLPPVGVPVRVVAALALAVILGGPAGYLMANYSPAELSEEGDIFGDNEFVALEPETWVGKRFPLLNHIDIGDQLAQGKWIIVLYQHDCSHCVDALPYYEMLAQSLDNQPVSQRVALIEMPGYAPDGSDPVPTDTACSRGRLSDDTTWFVQTPVEIVLEEASVISAEQGVER